MTYGAVHYESWQQIRAQLERWLAERYTDRLEISRILDASSIDSTKFRTDLSPLTTWNQIVRILESAPSELRRLLCEALQDYPNDETLHGALNALEGKSDPNGRVTFESLETAAGSRAAILRWLQNDWRRVGPCVCCIQGFSGIGKSHTADLLMASGSFQESSLVEIPEGRTSFQDFLLLVNESLDRDLNMRLVIGGDLALALEKIMLSPVLLVIDEFQNCLELDGTPLPGFESFFNRLRVARNHGRILLLSSRALDEDSIERVSVRTMGALSKPEGAHVLTNLLIEAGRESEIPDDLIGDVVSWLGGNPRALKTLVASLNHFPLEELIELDSAVWDLRNSRMSPEMILRLERRLIRKTYAAVSAESQRAMNRLAVHRRSFKYEAIEAITGSGQARNVTSELIDNFLLERRRNWYSLNPIVREVASGLLPEDTSGYASAHRAAASYYMRPFKARRATASRNAANFIEVRHHLMAIDELGQFADIAKLYALHLQKIYNRRTIVPSNQEELAQQIATLDGALAGGSPSSDLHYYLARLFLARDGKNDRARALDELKEAVAFPRCPLKAWSLLIDLGEMDLVCSALEAGSIELGDSMAIYLHLAKALRAVNRGDEAFSLLRAGLSRLGPEHNVVQFYEVAGKMMVASGRSEDALDLLREGIARFTPEHNVVQLYQAAAKLMAATKRDDALDMLSEGITRLRSEHSVSSLYHAAAQMMVAGGRRDEGLDLLRDGITHISVEHGVFQLYLAAARIMEAGGRRDDALDLLRGGIARISPEHGVLHLYLATSVMMVAGGRRDEALDLLRGGITHISAVHGVASIYQTAAKMLAGTGRADQAVDLLREGIASVDQEYGLVHIYQAAGRILAGAGQDDNALDLLRQGITRISPEHGVVAIYQTAAKMLADVGKDGQALDLLREGIARAGSEPGAAHIYQAAAGLLAGAERNEDAVDLLRDGIARLGPESNVAPLYQTAARMLADAGRDDEAFQLLREGISRVGSEPGVVHIYQTAARMHADAGRGDQALDLLREGIARVGVEPGAVQLYRAAARILTASGRDDEAIDLLRAGRQLGLALSDRLPGSNRPPPESIDD